MWGGGGGGGLTLLCASPPTSSCHHLGFTLGQSAAAQQQGWSPQTGSFRPPQPLLTCPPARLLPVVLSKWSGESEKTLRAVFDAARATQPSIIFLVRAGERSEGGAWMSGCMHPCIGGQGEGGGGACGQREGGGACGLGGCMHACVGTWPASLSGGWWVACWLCMYVGGKGWTPLVLHPCTLVLHPSPAP